MNMDVMRNWVSDVFVGRVWKGCDTLSFDWGLVLGKGSCGAEGRLFADREEKACMVGVYEWRMCLSGGACANTAF